MMEFDSRKKYEDRNVCGMEMRKGKGKKKVVEGRRGREKKG